MTYCLYLYHVDVYHVNWYLVHHYLVPHASLPCVSRQSLLAVYMLACTLSRTVPYSLILSLSRWACLHGTLLLSPCLPPPLSLFPCLVPPSILVGVCVAVAGNAT